MPTTTFNIPSPLRVSITKEDLATLITNNLVAPVGYFITNSSQGNIYVIGDLPNTIRKTAVRENSVTGKYEYGTYDLATDTFTVQSGGIAGITPSSGVNIDNTDPANPKPWINDFNLFLNPSGENDTVEWSLSGAGDISFESAELDSPNNKRMIKFDLAASNSALAEYDISTDYIGQKMVFKAMIKTDENLDVRIELDDVEVATAEVESSSEWQLVSVPFTPETGFTGNVKIFIENENAAVYFLDMMYVGVDVFQKLPYIPLTGTEAGKPVTGPIELDLASKIFNTNGIEEAGLGGESIDGLNALFLYFKTLAEGNKRGIGVNNTGVWVADEQGYGLIGTSYFSHGIPESFVQRKYVDDRLPKLITFANTQTLTSTTETDITESVIAVEANSTYEIEINFRVGCSGANGMQFGFKMPAGCTLMRSISGRTTGAGAQNISTNEHTSDTGLINMTVCTAATEFGNFTGKLLLRVGATAGNFIVTYASVNGSQTSSVFANSYIKYTKFS